jgi:hypothetical protein
VNAAEALGELDGGGANSRTIGPRDARIVILQATRWNSSLWDSNEAPHSFIVSTFTASHCASLTSFPNKQFIRRELPVDGTKYCTYQCSKLALVVASEALGAVVIPNLQHPDKSDSIKVIRIAAHTTRNPSDYTMKDSLAKLRQSM